MKNTRTFFIPYKFSIIAIIVIAIYLLLKSIFWPIQKNISVLIQQQQSPILNLETPHNTSKEMHFVFDQINFRKDDELFHANTGYLGFKNHFFMHLSTEIQVNKEANYLFRIISDDGFRLKINNSIVCEHIEGRFFAITECPYELNAGKYLLQIDYYQGIGQLGLKATYQVDKGDEYFVGQNSNLSVFNLADGILSPTYRNSTDHLSTTELKQQIQQGNSGDSYAQFELAEKYLSGNGVNKNNKEAFKWFKKAAINGEADAQFYLGRMYHQGIGIHQDIEKALYWLNLSANNFNSDAQYYISKLYYDGISVKQNFTTALYWLKKAVSREGEENQHPFFVPLTSGSSDADTQLLLEKKCKDS